MAKTQLHTQAFCHIPDPRIKFLMWKVEPKVRPDKSLQMWVERLTWCPSPFLFPLESLVPGQTRNCELQGPHPTPLYLERGESCVYILIQTAPQPTKTEMAKALEASPRQRPSCALFSTRVPGAAVYT